MIDKSKLLITSAILLLPFGYHAAAATQADVNSTAPTDEQKAAGGVSDGDIVVVARRREERLIDVPIAVSAVSAQDLARKQTLDLSGIQGTMPNVNLVQGRASSSNANIFIRGVGQPDAQPTFDPAIGIYVDGAYISRVQGALFNLFDVERVEVLRGPQGTLYGKNTIGGAVNIISKKPDLDEVHAAGSITYGRFDQVVANAYITTPLIADKLALSLAGVFDRRDGIVTDPLTGYKYNDRNTQAVRAILRAQPSDALEVIISADYTHQKTRPTLGYPTAALTQADTGTGVVKVILPGNPYGPYDYKASTSLDPSLRQKLNHWGVTGTVNYEVSDTVSLTSITSYRQLDPRLNMDTDASQFEAGGDYFIDIDQSQFAQELQAKYSDDNLSGVFGLYYLTEHMASYQFSNADDLQTRFGQPVALTRFINDDQRTRSYAAFGQATYKLSSKFSVTGGLRYTKEKKRYNRSTFIEMNGVNLPTFYFPGSLPAPYNADDELSFQAWTPSLNLSYKPTRDTLLYASVARGFKSGGFNGRVNSLADVTQVVDGQTILVPSFRPEKVWTYEAGAKGSFLNGRVRLAADAFYSDYTDFQARVGGNPDLGTGGGALPVLNAGKLRIWGIEAEATVKPSEALSLQATFGYLNAEYTEFNDGRRVPPAAFSCNPTGQKVVCEPAFAPPITVSLGADYKIPLGSVGSITFGGDVRFVDKHFLSVDNRTGLTENGYALANAYIQFDAEAGWYLRAGVKNLTNELYKTDAHEFSSVSNIQTAYFGDPRTWNVTAGFRF